MAVFQNTNSNIVTTVANGTGSLSLVGNLWTSANAYIAGDLTVDGNVTYINITSLNVEDPIISLGRGPNDAPLTSNDGKDRGENMWYYTTAEHSAFIGWHNSSGCLIAATNVSIANEIVTVNDWGTIRTGNLIADAITGNLASIVGNINAGNLRTTGLITATGNIMGGNISSVGRVVAGDGNATSPSYAFTSDGGVDTGFYWVSDGQIGITNNGVQSGTFGPLTLSMAGNVTGGNIITGGLITASGNITTAANVNVTGLITAGGNISTGANIRAAGLITASGNITGGNITATGISSSTNYSVINSAPAQAEGAQLVLAWKTVTGLTGQANSTWNMDVNGSDNYRLFYQNATGNTGVVFTGYSANADGAFTANVTVGGNISTAADVSAAGLITATGNIIGGNLITNGSANIGSITSSGNVDSGNILTSGIVSAAGNIRGANFNTAGLVTAGGNIITAANINAAGLITAGGNILASGLVSATGNIIGGNISTAGLITATGNITGGNVAGIIRPTAGNVNAGIIFPPDPGGGGGDSANIQYYAYSGESCVLELVVTNDPDDIIKLNATGGTSVVGNITAGNVLTGGLVSTTGNITGGNIITSGALTVTGNGTQLGDSSLDQITIGGSVTITNAALISPIWSSNAMTYVDQYKQLVTTSGLSWNSDTSTLNATIISATGNITGSYFFGNGSQLTGVTGVGTLTSLSVLGNVDAGNIRTAGLITATGNIITGAQINSSAFTGGNISWAANNRIDFQGSIKVGGSGILYSPGGASSITLNNSGANMPTANITQVSNATSTTTGSFTVAGGAGIAGNIYVGGIASITGNVTGGNLSITGNITGNTNGYAIGYLSIPQVAFSANATTALTDAGKHYYSTSASNLTLTLANNTSVGWAVGTTITIINQGTGVITIAQGSGVSLYFAGNSTAANRSLSTFGLATLINVNANTWFINGSGVY